MSPSRRLTLALLEAFAVLAPALAFLRYYGNEGSPEIGANLTHFGLLVTAWGTVLLVRGAAWALLPNRAAAITATAACTSVWLVLLLYYCVAALGLHGWGKIITWPIVRPYLAEFSALLDYLQIPGPLVFCGSLIVLAGASIFWWMITGPRDWVSSAAAPLSLTTLVVVFVGGGAAIAIKATTYFRHPPVEVGEPVSLTFFPPPPIHYGQRQWREDPRALARENEARRQLAASSCAPRRNVILIVSDALRADHLDLYGYGRKTSPYLSRRAKLNAAGPMVKAIAACAETSCAMPALLYSKMPGDLTQGAIGLSEALRTIGYRSYILLSGDHTNYYGLGEQYRPADIYQDATTQNKRFVNDDHMVLDFVDDLPSASATQPTFLQLHFQSNHPLGVRWSRSKWYSPSENYARWTKRKSVARMTDRERVVATNFYDNGVRQTDAAIEAAMRKLGDKGYLNDAFVVVTGDHGEMLGEHNILSHTVGVFQPVIEVPAIFLRYGYTSAPTPATTWISQTDIAPTIMLEISAPVPATWTGRAIQSGTRPEYISFQQGAEHGIIWQLPPYVGFKYWVDTSRNLVHVYDLIRDPGEKVNLAASLTAETRRRWNEAALAGAAQSYLGGIRGSESRSTSRCSGA